MLSVSALSEILKSCFENPLFQSLTVYGEVYSIKLGRFSYIEIGDQGHKETNAPLLKCAFSTYYGQDFGLDEIKVGDVIAITGSLSYYAHGSSITLWGREKVKVLQSQAGKNLLAKQKCLEKLEKLGYLDEKRKRKLPKYCRSVAILTASNGAAYQDILKTIHDRFPVSTTLFPIVVQGADAAASITKALERASKGDYDCILLGRGGGSKTDLSCFDDERVAMAIATSPIPVITSIGHTIDVSIADRVSDIRAITPTEGAALINPSKESISELRDQQKSRLKLLMKTYLDNKAMYLEAMAQRLYALSPKARLISERKNLTALRERLEERYSRIIREKKDSLDSLSEKLKTSIFNRIQTAKNEMQIFAKSLQNYDPTAIMKKGYALLYREGEKITSIRQLDTDDELELVYHDGRKRVRVL